MFRTRNTPVTFALMVLCGYISPVRSATLPAMAGHSWPDGFDTCFRSANAEMKNICPGPARKLIIPAEETKGGVFQGLVVNAAGDPGCGGVATCTALVVDTSNTIVSMSQIVQTTTSSNVQQLFLLNVLVPVAATIQFECDVGCNARVVNADFHGV
jgi:hypothetical protein